MAAETDEEANLSPQNPDMFDSVFLSIRQIPAQPELQIPFDKQVYELQIKPSRQMLLQLLVDIRFIEDGDGFMEC